MGQLPDAGKTAELSRDEFLRQPNKYFDQQPVKFTNADLAAVLSVMMGFSVEADVLQLFGGYNHYSLVEYNNHRKDKASDEFTAKLIHDIAMERFPHGEKGAYLLQGGYTVASAEECLANIATLFSAYTREHLQITGILNGMQHFASLCADTDKQVGTSWVEELRRMEGK